MGLRWTSGGKVPNCYSWLGDGVCIEAAEESALPQVHLPGGTGFGKDSVSCASRSLKRGIPLHLSTCENKQLGV